MPGAGAAERKQPSHTVSESVNGCHLSRDQSGTICVNLKLTYSLAQQFHTTGN